MTNTGNLKVFIDCERIKCLLPNYVIILNNPYAGVYVLLLSMYFTFIATRFVLLTITSYVLKVTTFAELFFMCHIEKVIMKRLNIEKYVDLRKQFTLFNDLKKEYPEITIDGYFNLIDEIYRDDCEKVCKKLKSDKKYFIPYMSIAMIQSVSSDIFQVVYLSLNNKYKN